MLCVPKFASKEMYKIYVTTYAFTSIITLLSTPTRCEKIQTKIPIPEGLNTENTTITGILNAASTNVMKDTVIKSSKMFVNTKLCSIELCGIFSQEITRLLYCQNLAH